MSFLRRRFLGDKSGPPEPSREPTPDNNEEVQLVSKKRLEELKSWAGPTTRKRSTWSIFVLGGLFGVVVAAFFANQSDVINLNGLLDMNLDSLIDVIPASIIKDAKELTVCYIIALT